MTAHFLCKCFVIIAALFATSNFSSSAIAQDEKEKLPEGFVYKESLKIPSVKEILESTPFDWVVMESGRVAITSPIPHRPFAIRKQNDRIKELSKKIESFRISDPDKAETYRQEKAMLDFLYFEVPAIVEEEESVFKVLTSKIEKVVHFEDMILQRIDLLIEENDFRTAFDLLLFLTRKGEELKNERKKADQDGLLPSMETKRNQKGEFDLWPGILKREYAIAFVEAKSLIDQNQLELALIKLEDLFNRQSKYEGLDRLTGQVADKLISQSVSKDDFRKARHFLNRIKSMFPQNKSVVSWSKKLSDTAVGLIKQASQLKSKGEPVGGVDLLRKAIEVWPSQKGLENLHNREASRNQILHVGVLDLALPPQHSFLWTDAQTRYNSLTKIPLFQVNDVSDGSPHYRSRFFEEWTPTDLGRELTFQLRTERQPWEAHPLITSDVIISQLQNRLNPKSTSYDERLDFFVKGVRTQSPSKFIVELDYVPVRPETLLKTNALNPQSVDGEDKSSQRFPLISQTDSEVRFRRALAEPDKNRDFHVMEIREHLYPNIKRAIQAVNRREIHCLPYVPIKGISRLKDDPKYFVVQYSQPRTHVIQFDPQSPVYQSKALRKALRLSLDREKIMNEVFMDEVNSEDILNQNGRVVTAPYATTHAAYNRLIKPKEYAPIAARALLISAFTSREEEKTKIEPIPPIRLLCPEQIEIQEAAKKIIAAWRLIGLKARIVNWSKGISEPGSWDLVYRAMRMNDPQSELWPFLTMQNRSRTKDLDILPQWLRVEIMEMDSANNWNEADKRLQNLHSHLASESMSVPLWELEEYMLFHRNVREFQKQPLQTYDRVDQWVIEPMQGELNP